MKNIILLICLTYTVSGCGGKPPCSSVDNNVDGVPAAPPTSNQSTIENQMTPSERDTNTSPAASEISEKPQEDAEIYNGPPMELIKENMETTHYTGVVTINEVEITGPGGGPVDGSGYVNHVYHVSVNESLVGNAGENLTYSVMADADSTPRAAGAQLLVNLCRAATAGTYYTPDNGYVFSADDTLLKKVKELNVSSTPNAHPAACGD